jgi:hypothetical protein
MEDITREIIDDFESITKFDIRTYLTDYTTFNDIHYQKIINFYTQVSDVFPQSSFDFLKKLRSSSNELIDVLSSNSASLSHYKFWILTEFIEDIITSLNTANNSSRWTRSSIVNYNYSNNTQVDLVTRQNQSLEDLERELSSENPEEDWVDTALINQLREEDYTPEGGVFLKATFKTNKTISLESVVDNLDSSQKTYGKDLYRKLTIVNNDLQTLPYRDTIQQAVEIISSMRRGDNPIFPEDGVDHSLVVGNNFVGAFYPTVFRQLAATFAKDDTFSSFAILNIDKQLENTVVYFQVETRVGDFFNNKINL